MLWITLSLLAIWRNRCRHWKLRSFCFYCANQPWLRIAHNCHSVALVFAMNMKRTKKRNKCMIINRVPPLNEFKTCKTVDLFSSGFFFVSFSVMHANSIALSIFIALNLGAVVAMAISVAFFLIWKIMWKKSDWVSKSPRVRVVYFLTALLPLSHGDDGDTNAPDRHPSLV